MRALVTGGAGFIGRHLVDALRAQGAHVRVVDLANEPPLAADVDFRRGSITDGRFMRDAVSDCEWVFHLAANAQLWARDESVFDRVNHGGTRTLLAAAARTASVKRIVCTATEAVLIGRRTAFGPTYVDETAEPAESDMFGPYCLSKYRAQAAALEAAGQGLPVVIVNPTLPMGPGDFGFTPPTRMLADFVAGRTPAYLDTFINVVDVRDAALGHILAAEKGEVGARYILGGENISMSDFLDHLQRLTDRRMPKTRVPYAVALGTAYIEAAIGKLTGRMPRAPLTGVRIAGRKVKFDNKKAREELGFSPRALDVTLQDAIAWLACHAA